MLTLTLSRSVSVSCMSTAVVLCCAFTANSRLHLAEQLGDAAAAAAATAAFETRNIRAPSAHLKAFAVP
jgi:hypothetical protein